MLFFYGFTSNDLVGAGTSSLPTKVDNERWYPIAFFSIF